MTGDQNSISAGKRKPGRPKKSAMEHAEIKSKISQVASELFRSEGYHAVSMRRIAKAIGVTPMALYTYFPSKLAILGSLWAEIFDDVAREMLAGEQQADDPAERLAAISKIYVDYWLRHRDRYFLVFMSRGLDRDEVRDFVSEGGAVATYDPFYDLIAAAIGADRSGTEVKERGDRLICGLMGVVHCTITIPGHDWTPVDALVAGFVTSVNDT